MVDLQKSSTLLHYYKSQDWIYTLVENAPHVDSKKLWVDRRLLHRHYPALGLQMVFYCFYQPFLMSFNLIS